MAKVITYSLLLVIGLAGGQIFAVGAPHAYAHTSEAINLLTMLCLAFIMIHVGYEFEIDKSNVRSYAWDYVVAATAAAFPWVFSAAYFVFVLMPAAAWYSSDAWKEALLVGRFASPTSAGVLFSMLAAAGLGATWVFRKARVLAIFDDIDTILFMIPLKMMMVGLRGQLAVVVVIMTGLLWGGWRYMHAIRLPRTWPWVLTYAAAITAVCEGIHLASKQIDELVPIHLEVLLPAFVLGCVMARGAGENVHGDDALAGHEIAPDQPTEQRVATLISALFMVLVGLSMPPLASLLGAEGGGNWPGWGVVSAHVLGITILSNLGKMYPAMCYRSEANLRERLAVATAMFPRGEVGGGVLVASLSYGVGGLPVLVGALSLALNLLLTGVFIAAVKMLIALPSAGGVARAGRV
jgi:Kef-type K+ transport system membrane component KefB